VVTATPAPKRLAPVYVLCPNVLLRVLSYFHTLYSVQKDWIFFRFNVVMIPAWWLRIRRGWPRIR